MCEDGHAVGDGITGGSEVFILLAVDDDVLDVVVFGHGVRRLVVRVGYR